MPHYHNQFDVVHARSCANGIPDFPAFIAEMVACLKPGGILLLVEADFQLYDEDKGPMDCAFDQSGSGSWLARILFEVYNTLKSRSSAVDAPTQLFKWIQEHPDLKDEVGMDLFIPIGPWLMGADKVATERVQYVGHLMRENLLELTRAFKPMLVEEAYSPDTIDRWIAGADAELGQLSVHMYTKWHYACAIKVGDKPKPPSYFMVLEDNDVAADS